MPSFIKISWSIEKLLWDAPQIDRQKPKNWIKTEDMLRLLVMCNEEVMSEIIFGMLMTLLQHLIMSVFGAFSFNKQEIVCTVRP